MDPVIAFLRVFLRATTFQAVLISPDPEASSLLSGIVLLAVGCTCAAAWFASGVACYEVGIASAVAPAVGVFDGAVATAVGTFND